MNDILVALAAGALIVVGLFGSVLPLLPGQPLSYAGLFLYAWYTDFEKITPTILIIFGVLTALTMVFDFIAPGLGAKSYKASRLGVIGSTLGAFAGIFVLGPFGIIIGPFIGGFAGELISGRNYEHALRSAWGSFVGFALGSLFKLAVVIGMLVYFIYSLF
jgi:uncharacterized protein